MATPDKARIKRFLHDQIAFWNDEDKERLFALYREYAPGSLVIEFVGRPIRDGWLELEEMWEKTHKTIKVEEIKAVISGSEAVCHMSNKLVKKGIAVDSLETYAFGPGTLKIRYFIES